MKTIAAAAPILLAAALAARAEGAPPGFAPVLDAYLAEAKAQCDALGGEFSAAPDAAPAQADFDGDGIADPILDSAALSCSTAASLFSGGTGGSYVNVFVSDGGAWRRFEFLARGVMVAPLGEPPALLLRVHPSACDVDGPAPCFAAYAWIAGRFVAAGGVVEPAN